MIKWRRGGTGRQRKSETWSCQSLPIIPPPARSLRSFMEMTVWGRGRAPIAPQSLLHSWRYDKGPRPQCPSKGIIGCSRCPAVTCLASFYVKIRLGLVLFWPTSLLWTGRFSILLKSTQYTSLLNISFKLFYNFWNHEDGKVLIIMKQRAPFYGWWWK